MDFQNYHFPYKGTSRYLKYFSSNPFKRWNYDRFESHFLDFPKKKLEAAYHRSLQQIGDHDKTPTHIKEWINGINEAVTKNSSAPSSSTGTTYNIMQGSSFVHCGNNNTITTTNHPHQPAQQGYVVPVQQAPPLSPSQQQQQQSQPQQQSSSATTSVLPQSLHHQHFYDTRKRRAVVANEEAQQRKRSHVIEEDFIEEGQDASTNTDDSIAGTDLVAIMANFLNSSDFSDFHQYRLESHGIVQVGKYLARKRDVPSLFYDSIVLEDDIDPKLQPFPIKKFTNFLQSTLFHDDYGTRDLLLRILSGTGVEGTDRTETNFITWAILNLSQNVYTLQNQSRLADSEVSYCHYGWWPMIDLVCDSLQNLQSYFKVGETPLSAMKSLPPSLPGYSADGTVFLKDTGLEVLLFEASGAYGTRDRRRHTYDHIKGAYGCYAMLNAILTKYPYADHDLMNDLCVLFLHSSGKDDYIRLWVMKPCHDGSVMTFERMDKAIITTNRHDTTETIGIIRFFWKVKGMIERSCAAIDKLKDSSNANFLLLDHDNSELNPSLLPSLLKPQPIKPKYDTDCKGIVDLDPVSILF